MQDPPVTSAQAPAERDESTNPLWWTLLVTGSLWILFALLVFRFDYTTVATLSILVGTVCVAAAVLELVMVFSTAGWWRVAHAGLSIAFAIIGLLAYVHPENTFNALASIFAFYLLLRGIFDVVAGLLVRPAELWWLGLVFGAVQIMLAFWAAGDFGHKAFLLVVWVGGSALVHGILQLVTAFRLRPRQGPMTAA